MSLNVKELYKILEIDNCAFLCGNGFSINFDNNFSNIYDRLYTSHKKLIHNTEYTIKSNSGFLKKINDNYKNVLSYLRNINKKNLLGIFEDALIFANSILNNEQLIQDLIAYKMITKLVFEFSELDILKNICTMGNNNGIKSVNIENWTILVYFYHAIELLNIDYYKYPPANSFITIIKVGDKNKLKLIDEPSAINDTISNGFITYYRMLFSTAIFSDGKAIDFKMLSNINKLNIEKIKIFLEKFNLLMSLNYDRIIENLLNKKVEHLHGEFLINERQYVYNQNLVLHTQNGLVDFSDILIGDYFIFKTFLPQINRLSSINKKIEYIGSKIDRLIKENSINTIIIFGVSIENDYHILRNLMLGLCFAGIDNPHIIYCYFSESEKEEFGRSFKKLITFDKETTSYSRNIKISYIKTQDILNNVFYN